MLIFFLRKIFTRVEQQKVGLLTFFKASLFVIIVRNFFENIFECSHKIVQNIEFYLQIVDFFHITQSWLLVLLTFSIIISFFSNKTLIEVIKSALIFFPIIILVPLLDYFYFGSGSIFYQNNFTSFLFSYLHFFDPWVHIQYVTGGVRVEVFIAVVISAFYTFYYTNSIFRSLLTSLFIYSSVFFYAYLPAIYHSLLYTSVEDILKHSVIYSRSPIQLNFFIYLPILLFFSCYFYFSLKKTLRRGIWVSIRIERLSIYVLLTISGIVITAINSFIFENIFNIYDLLKIISVILSVTCAFIYAVIVNDIHDYQVDCISNKNRPLVTGDINISIFSDMKVLMLILSFFFAIPINQHFIFIILFIIALSSLYSSPPFRLRRVFIISNCILALIGVAFFLLGASVIDGNLSFMNTDMNFLFGLFLYFFIASHFKDIKDVCGDSRNGVVTLATLIGAKNAYMVTSCMFAMIMILFGVILNLGLGVIISNTFFFLFFALYLNDSEKLLSVIQICSVFLFIFYVYSL